MIKYSIIISAYNEEKVIGNCLASLTKQTVAKDMEVIVVDDGSIDETKSKVKSQKSKVILLEQNHLGTGAARNFGVKRAKGEILIIVDADMEFAPDFIEKLCQPIIARKAIGTFSKEEYLLNKEFAIARCWNLNLGRKAEKMHPDNYPDTQAVFRAILRSQFLQAGGFDPRKGYTDDWSLSEKLGVMAKLAPGAVYYHRNPETFREVWTQARWFGKNSFLTGNLIRRFYNLFRYFPLFAIFRGLYGSVKFFLPEFFLFKIVFDTAVFTSVLLSFAGESKAK